MRTTLNIDDDVLDKAKNLASKLRAPFRLIVNEALRKGLEKNDVATKTRPYRTKAHTMGLRPGINLDNIHELLAQAEGENYK